MARPSYEQLMQELYAARVRINELSTDPTWQVTTAAAAPYELSRLPVKPDYSVTIACNDSRDDEKMRRLLHMPNPAALLTVRTSDDTATLYMAPSDMFEMAARYSAHARKMDMDVTIVPME